MLFTAAGVFAVSAFAVSVLCSCDLLDDDPLGTTSTLETAEPDTSDLSGSDEDSQVFDSEDDSGESGDNSDESTNSDINLPFEPFDD